ncbi:MAG TPA: hypothetical protein VMU17_01495 [Elusimicrobiota bacterium]|nr:hypothetical protein [Elusimicrobiota bacterium]
MESVIITDPLFRDVVSLARVLAAWRGGLFQDHVPAARSARGIIGENLSDDDAGRLVEQCEAAAIPVATVTSGDLPVPAGAISISRLEWADAAGGLFIYTGSDEKLQLRQLGIIASAAITFTTTVTTQVKEGPSVGQKMLNTGIFMATGLPIKFGGKERTVDKTRQESDVRYYADLVLRESGRRYRLDAQRMDYAFLGSRKQYHTFGNFKVVLADLAKEHPGALQNFGTRTLLTHQPVSQLDYAGLSDLDREVRWLLALAKHHRSPS